MDKRKFLYYLETRKAQIESNEANKMIRYEEDSISAMAEIILIEGIVNDIVKGQFDTPDYREVIVNACNVYQGDCAVSDSQYLREIIQVLRAGLG